MQTLRKGWTAISLSLLFVLSSPFALNAQTPNTVPGAKIKLFVITLSDEDFAKYVLEYPNAAENGVPSRTVQFFGQDEAKKRFVSLQSMKSVTVMQAPNVTVSSARKATISCGDTKKFVTSLEEKTVNGKTVHIPKNESMLDGMTATVCPTVSADRKMVSLKLDIKRTTIDPIVPLHPVTYFITPIFEGGSQGTPIPFTQFIQKPNVDAIEYQTTISLPEGSSAVMYAGKQTAYTRMHGTRGMFDDIPYVSRLFKNNAYGKESQHVIIVAAANVVELPAVDEYMDDYRAAVAEGRLDDAKRLAIKAIEADPKCFAK